jgi:uncharacterized protein
MVKKKKEKTRPDWRTVAQEVAYTATLHEARERWDVEDHPANYRWTHVQAVVDHAKRLAQLTGADPEVCEAAAWLHDCAKQGVNDDHGQEGAKKARAVLRETDFPPRKIKAVSRAISRHVGLYLDKPVKPLEAAVLWDADKLTKVGLGSTLLHITSWVLTERGPISALLTSAADQDWVEKTVASFHTAPARQIAQTRLAAQRTFWEQVAAELAAEDLTAPDRKNGKKR